MTRNISIIILVLGLSSSKTIAELSDRNLAICPGDSILDSNGSYCCPASCEWCGGSSCDTRPGGAANCCTSQIERSCDDNDAPCKINPSSYDSNICPGSGILDSSGKICCTLSCGRCGGEGCDKLPGGASNCCTSQITELCDGSDPTKVPCVLTEIETSDLCPDEGIINSTGEFCCPKGCLTCGGIYCSSGPLGLLNCCTSQIYSSCDEGQLPCKITSNEDDENDFPQYASCPTGGIPSSSGAHCCPESCGTCGGEGCDTRPGGSSACCTSSFERPCIDNFLPCVMTEDSMCPLGGIYDVEAEYCCPSTCGSCGGLGCDKRPGGVESCCTSSVTTSCNDEILPCKVTTVCPTNGILDLTGNYCCDSSCGFCGGDGCEDRGGDGIECCTSRAYVTCEQDRDYTVLPCRRFPDTDFSMCDTGLIGSYPFSTCRDVNICTPASCSKYDYSLPCYSSPECCAIGLSLLPNDAETSCRYNSPPCVIPLEDELCLDFPCQNGARCAIEYNSFEGYCGRQPVCVCDEIGNFAGEFCEIPCGDDEAPCGREYIYKVSTGRVGFDDVCCSADKECRYIGTEVGYNFECVFRDRPTSCEPNPCLNGGWCENANPYGNTFIGLCNCPEGFSGAFCENIE
mmetsp:Transcript_19570/g.27529  ORF Transcript_19570/g.27529 Transcript_19570/m.27529 type:complete len:628 (+) Transcript_19570:188-2071(+)